eukprot:GEMP01002885.1.p1 GENE.GEMP01002885.1~~GEMP01002885.1.p1  ORF type:complete len:1270 (+),score=78.50 GEMP01002885.1:178-3987(+)
MFLHCSVFVLSFAWLGHGPLESREFKLRAHEESDAPSHEVSLVAEAQKAGFAAMKKVMSRAIRGTSYESNIDKVKFVQVNAEARASKTSPNPAEMMGEYFELGQGKCVLSGEVEPAYYFSAAIKTADECKKSCREKIKCYGIYADSYGCFHYEEFPLRAVRQTAAAAATSGNCYVKSSTYSIYWPYLVFSSELIYEGCFAEEGIRNGNLEIEAVEKLSGDIRGKMYVNRCGVACAGSPYFYVENVGKCHCVKKEVVDHFASFAKEDDSVCQKNQQHCGMYNDEDFYKPDHNCGSFDVVALYKSAGPKQYQDCPDGEDNIPSRYIVAGSTFDVSSYSDAGAVAHCQACANKCTARGTSCHGYTCSIEKMTDSVFESLNEDNMSTVLNCKLVLDQLPIPDVEVLLNTQNAAGNWKETSPICARRTCLEDTICGPGYQRVPGFKYLTSELALTQVVGSCSECAALCDDNGDCKSYQCAESLDHCYLFTGNQVDEEFNVSDVAFCRKPVDEVCSISDGLTAISRTCQCGTVVCILGNNSTVACHIDAATGVTGECLTKPSGCPENEIRVNYTSPTSSDTGDQCECKPRIECDNDAGCQESEICEEEQYPCVKPGCSDAPAANTCVHCCQGATCTTNDFNSTCAANCYNLKHCNGAEFTSNITSGTCANPNNCTGNCDDNGYGAGAGETCTDANAQCGSDGVLYRSRCDLEAAAGNVTLLNAGPCVSVCTHVGDTDCQCGSNASKCEAGTYCNVPDSTTTGTCVVPCDDQTVNHTNCICTQGNGTNTVYVYCGNNANNQQTHCPPDGVTNQNETLNTCVPSCDDLDLSLQAQQVCLCNDANEFCSEDSICTTVDGTKKCVEVCSEAGDSDNCVCGVNTDGTPKDICKGVNAAVADNSTTPIGIHDSCTCQPECQAAGETDCICKGPEGQVPHCKNGELCSGIKESGGTCSKPCSEIGQTDCLCGSSNPDEPFEYCNSTTGGGSYCTGPTPKYTLVTENGVPSDTATRGTCAPICEIDDTDCFCLDHDLTAPETRIAVGTPLCISDGAALNNYCNKNATCEPGCSVTDGTEATTKKCICGVSSNGINVKCEAGEHCIQETLSGNTSNSTCTPKPPKQCGGTALGNAQGYLTGFTASNDACQCDDANTICAVNTFCVAETGDCLTDQIQPCDVCPQEVNQDPCYCCEDITAARNGFGACPKGDICTKPGECKCGAPIKRCHATLESDCICGQSHAFCTQGKAKCEINVDQKNPDASKCNSTSNCNLSLYGHCAPIL